MMTGIMGSSVGDKASQSAVKMRSQSGPACVAMSDNVGERTTPGRFLATMQDTLGRPKWFLEGTSLVDAKEIPNFILVKDYLKILENIWINSINRGYYIDYIISGVPFYSGPLDLGLRFAPNLLSAFDLLQKYGNDRPGYHHFRIHREGGRVAIELLPMTDLGKGRPIVVETPLIYLARIAQQYSGGFKHKIDIEFNHNEHDHSERIQQFIGGDIRYNSDCDLIIFPLSICKIGNINHDAEFWKLSLLRCEEEFKLRNRNDIVGKIRRSINALMVRNGKTPRLSQVSQELGVSDRTVIRRLRSEGINYQEVLDNFLLERCKTLLSDPTLSVSAIADMLGFSDASGLHRSFKRWHGMTCNSYRQSLKLSDAVA
jgi:AraC-like DNA-binding protein